MRVNWATGSTYQLIERPTGIDSPTMYVRAWVYYSPDWQFCSDTYGDWCEMKTVELRSNDGDPLSRIIVKVVRRDGDVLRRRIGRNPHDWDRDGDVDSVDRKHAWLMLTNTPANQNPPQTAEWDTKTSLYFSQNIGDQRWIDPGKWICLELGVYRHDTNGWVKVWIDDSLAMDWSAANFGGSWDTSQHGAADNGTLFLNGDYHHAQAIDFGAPHAQTQDWDDVMISTQRIGCGAPPSTTAPPVVENVHRTDK